MRYFCHCSGCFHPAKGSPFLSFILLYVVSFGVAAASAQESLPSTPIAPEETPQTVHIEPVLNKGDLQIDRLDDSTEVVFRKEPEYAGGNVVRGVFPTGTQKEAFVGYAWDCAGSHLYIDRNQNLDLTDDGTPKPAMETREGVFQDVQIPVQRGAAKQVYHANLVFYNGQLGHMVVNSGWAGTVNLAGRPHALLVMENMDGIFDAKDAIVLAPPGGLEKPPDARLSRALPQSDQHVEWLPLAKTLHIDGHTYALNFAFQGDGIDLTFRETHPPMGQVVLTGPHVNRIVLGGETAAVLEPSEKPIPIPAGTYSTYRVFLNYGDVKAALLATGTQDTVIPPDRETELPFGPPLTNALIATPSGGFLKLDCQLLGRGGESYVRSLASQFPFGAVRPRFTVYKGCTPVASGTFEYG